MIDKCAAHGRPTNAILGQLPAGEYEALAKFMVEVELPPHKTLSEPNESIEYVYFLNRGLISTDAMTQSGETVEVGVIGREGFAGLPALLNQPQMSHAVVVQSRGSGIRVRSGIVREQFLRGGMLQSLVYNFAYLQMTQTAQSVLCNRLHTVDQRLARWLLVSADRMESEELHLTHEFLSHMLGVQRSTVTVAAGEMQRQGMIGYSRGKIYLLDRLRLAGAACECYGIVAAAYGRLLHNGENHCLRYVV
ncbi:MAG TPA: Crp/Fnr family transcriptional regulator [Granulicella sp.]|nr:Crp/Fnr family transcriptional regulator [Granulicella sp.]